LPNIWKKARVIGVATTSDPIPGTVSMINTETEDLRWACELGADFEPGALKPPPIEAVPFDKAVGAYSRLAAR
jgi:hypothetical protein